MPCGERERRTRELKRSQDVSVAGATSQLNRSPLPSDLKTSQLKRSPPPPSDIRGSQLKKSPPLPWNSRGSNSKIRNANINRLLGSTDAPRPTDESCLGTGFCRKLTVRKASGTTNTRIPITHVYIELSRRSRRYRIRRDVDSTEYVDDRRSVLGLFL